VIIFVRDSRNRILAPTLRYGWAAKQVQRGLASWKWRSGLLTLVLAYPVRSKTREKYFYVVGMDTGYSHVGVAVVKVGEKRCLLLFSGTALLRTKEISKLLAARKMYRQNRRHHRRCNTGDRKF